MKVRCRGFEGKLISINPTGGIINGLAPHYQLYFYEIKISICIGQEITISGVKDEDIEFIKEEN